MCHAAYVANMVLPGDPVWVFLIGGSGQGKTERLAPLSGMPHVELASTLSGEAALLSATARKDRAEHAHGGLLRRIGDKGVLIIKDFTSILEMDRTARGQVSPRSARSTTDGGTVKSGPKAARHSPGKANAASSPRARPRSTRPTR